jgi:hypothetical protein
VPVCATLRGALLIVWFRPITASDQDVHGMRWVKQIPNYQTRVTETIIFDTMQRTLRNDATELTIEQEFLAPNEGQIRSEIQ